MRTFLAVLLVATACARPAPPAAPAQEVDGTTAHRVARAGVLRTGDVPGFTALRDDGSDAGGVPSGSCLAHGAAPVTTRAASFRRGTVYVISSVDVLGTLAAVRAKEAFLRDEFPRCYERFLTFWFAQSDVTVTKYRSTPFRVRVPGTAAAFGYRVTLTARANGRSVPAAATVVAATTGHAELMVQTMAIRAQAPGQARLTQLLSTMVKRAAAAER